MSSSEPTTSGSVELDDGRSLEWRCQHGIIKIGTSNPRYTVKLRKNETVADVTRRVREKLVAVGLLTGEFQAR